MLSERSERSTTPVARLLGMLAEGGIHTTTGLADRLGVTQELVNLMAEDLARRGYLVKVGDDCGSGCHGCALSGGCAPPQVTAAPLFALTVKGRRAAGGG